MRVAKDIAALVPHPDAAILDHGCGEALSADHVAAHCGRLLLCDASPRQREALARRFSGNTAIAVLSPDEVAALSPASLDLVVAISWRSTSRLPNSRRACATGAACCGPAAA